jgi:hypothetical protein
MGVESSKSDLAGNAVGFLLGILVGLLLAAPAFPRGVEISIGSSTLSPAGSALVAGALAVIFVPVAVFALYIVFATTE